MGSADEWGSLTIVIPTFNERDNLEPLFRRLAAARQDCTEHLEIVVVDDGSPDGTGPLARRLAERYGLPVRVLGREGRRSMGKAILTGIALARSELVCVMDADLSHPPELIPDLLRALDGADGAIASRYVPGGTIARWAPLRRVISWGATALSRAFVRTPCDDPLSGFFLFRRASLEDVAVTGIGNKPLLEILARKPLTIHEIPYEFRDRERGSSKLDLKGFVDFARLLVRLSWQSFRGTSPRMAHGTETPAEARGP